MTINKDKLYIVQLKKILTYVASDKRTATIKFEAELNNKILLLLSNLYLFRQSVYFEHSDNKDLIYQGYTIIYKVDK